VSILERLRDETGSTDLGRFSKNLRRDLPSIGQDNRSPVERLVEAAGRAADEIARSAERAAGGAAKGVEQVGGQATHVAGQAGRDTIHLGRDLGRDVAETAGDAIGTVTSAAGEVVARVGDRAARAGRELRLDERVEDVVQRIRQDLPTERITNLVTSLERELPTTDKDRYDRAFARGWTRARATFVGAGLVTGLLAGIAGAFLLDAQRGTQRREQLAASVRGTTRGVTRVLRRRATWTADRARGIAIERGLITPEGGRREEPVMQATPAAGVPVMDPAVVAGSASGAPFEELGTSGDTEPVMPLADGPVTDASSIEREPMTAAEGGVIGGALAPDQSIPEPAPEHIGEMADDDSRLPVNTSAVTSTLEPEAENATITGDDADRGTWHRNL